MPAADGRTDQGYLNRLPANMLPKTVVGDIFSKAKDQSILMSLGKQIPVSINETVITAPGPDPEAGQVGGTTLASREGALKPLTGIDWGTEKSFMPIKLAVIVTVSEEFARENVEGMYSELAGKLSGAIARGADLAVFHGRSALTGAALVGIENNGFLSKTTNEVVLNMAAGANPSLAEQIITGYDLVVEDEEKGYDFTGFAAVPRLRSKLAVARDANGDRILGGGPVSLAAAQSDLLGLPLTYGRIVGGKVGASTRTNVQIIGGDFSQLAYGFADQIKVKVTDTATVGGVSMWQTNQIAILAEATFGWYVNDTDAFVKYVDVASV